VCGRRTPLTQVDGSDQQGGFAITFPGNFSFDEYTQAVSSVLLNGWLDRQTREVKVSMHLYNVVDHFTINVRTRTTLRTTHEALM
jgi:hypothetical protein